MLKVDTEVRQLLIFPEGSTSNRSALLNFKPGGFLAGQAVQPVLVNYPGPAHRDTVSWTWDMEHGLAGVIFYTLTRLHTRHQLLPSMAAKSFHPITRLSITKIHTNA